MAGDIGLICKECAEERKARLQQNIDEEMSNVKARLDKDAEAWLKVKLTSGDRNEHVWIRVTGIDLIESIFTGYIDNDIVLVDDKYSYKDEVIMGFKEIEEISVKLLREFIKYD